HGPSAVGHRAARGLRPRLRAGADVRYGSVEHPRRDPLRPDAGERGLLTGDPASVAAALRAPPAAPRPRGLRRRMTAGNPDFMLYLVPMAVRETVDGPRLRRPSAQSIRKTAQHASARNNRGPDRGP